MSQPAAEKTFSFEHRGEHIEVTVWNFNRVLQPHVLFDFNNVLNAYPLKLLQKETGTLDQPYAIVSLLMTKGHNFEGLHQRALETGECIVALTAKIKGERVKKETGLKYQVMKKLHWKNVQFAVDDKPHEWYSDSEIFATQLLSLDASKKPVYKISFQ
jgi:hypothetical protein